MSISQTESARKRGGVRRFLFTAVAGVAVAAVLAACAGGTASPSASPAATPVAGGTLTIANAGVAHDTLDAMTGILRAEAIHAQLVYSTLMKRADDFTVEPDLAESMKPNKDSTAWTVKLRKGVTFSDGKPLTADDVIFSLNRMTDPKVFAISGVLFSPPLPTITSIDKVDDLTLVINLSAPNTILDQLVTDPQTSIYPTNWDATKPIGTGPYTLVSLEKGSRAVFKKNPTYFGDAPYVDEIISIEIPDATARLNALYAGQVDVALQTSEAQVATTTQNGFDVLRNKSGTYPLITMNSETGPFTDPKVRKALQLAIDRKQIQTNVYGGKGQIGSDVPGIIDPDFDKSLVRDRDVAEAKKLMKESGFTGSITTVFRARDAVMAQTLQQSAAEAGITLDLQQVPDAQYSSPQYLSQPLRFDGAPAYSFIVNSLFFDTPKAFTWYSKWTDKEYLDLRSKYFETSDKAERTKLSHEMQKILFDRGPYLLPIFPDSLVGHAKNVQGLPTGDPYGFGLSGLALAKVFLAK